MVVYKLRSGLADGWSEKGQRFSLSCDRPSKRDAASEAGARELGSDISSRPGVSPNGMKRSRLETVVLETRMKLEALRLKVQEGGLRGVAR